MAGVLFEDIFVIKEVDAGGKKFDKVSRLECLSESLRMKLILDVATQYYPIYVGEKFRLVLASTLNEDGTPGSDFYNRLERPPPYMDHFEYVMYGKVYRVDDISADNSDIMSVYASYGGLLMRLDGHSSTINCIEKGQNIYLLVKKIAF